MHKVGDGIINSINKIKKLGAGSRVFPTFPLTSFRLFGRMGKMNTTKEDKTAMKLADLLNDIQIDLDEIGEVYAKSQSTLMVNRLLLVAEAAYETKKGVASHVGLHQNYAG